MSVNAFVPSFAGAYSSRHRLFMNADSEEVDDDYDDISRGKARRMSDVRAVQSMFYSSDADSSLANEDTESSSPWLDYGTGIFYNLSLWREKMGYTELSGRSLIGFVKDPAYTHMFETLLRSGNEELYFGQLRQDNMLKDKELGLENLCMIGK